MDAYISCVLSQITDHNELLKIDPNYIASLLNKAIDISKSLTTLTDTSNNPHIEKIQLMIDRLQLHTNNQITNNSDCINKIYTAISDVSHKIDILKSKPITKGNMTETIVFTALSQRYNNAISVKSGHSGDIIIDDILIEVKNYARSVPKKELDKFYRDITTTNSNSGILVSISSDIVGFPNNFNYFKLLINKRQVPIIILHTNNIDLIYTAIDLLKSSITLNNDKMDIIKSMIEDIMYNDNTLRKMHEYNNKTIIELRNRLIDQKKKLDYILKT